MIAQYLATALDLWVELSGLDPNSNKVNMGSYEVRKMHENIREALMLDPTNVTGCLLLDHYATEYFNDRSVTIMDLLKNPDESARYVRKAAQLLALTRNQEITTLRDAFVQELKQAIRSYGVGSEAVMKTLGNHGTIALLRRDALRSMEKNLRADQFLKGLPENDGVKPKYNPQVYQFWNINSLLAASCRMPSGISLCLIRDPDEFQSYFAFAVRNGGNLFLLSDIEDYSHPLQRYMSRRPDRTLSNRAAKNHYPYDLLAIKYDEDSDRLFVDASQQSGVVPYQQESFPLKSIADLAPSEIIWITMMFDLIVQRFWHGKHHLPELSYTVEMIRENTPLLEAATKANLPVIQYDALTVSPLDVEDVLSAAGSDAVGSDGGRPLAWMEKHYAHQVTPEILNLMSGTDRYIHCITTESDAIETLNRAEFADKYPSWRKKETGAVALNSLPATHFGTKEKVLADRMFVARRNMALAINRLAEREYQERREEIAGWYEKSVRKNLKTLLEMVSAKTVWVTLPPDFDHADINNVICNHIPPGQAGENAGLQYHLMETARLNDDRRGNNLDPHGRISFSLGFFYSGVLFDQRSSPRAPGTCFITGASKISYWVCWQPQTAADLALLAGCKIAELPDVLQCWAKSTRHQGNHLLSRIDPMAWTLCDPWQKHNFNIKMILSMRGYRQICKEHYNPRWHGTKQESLEPEMHNDNDWAERTFPASNQK